MNILTDFQKKVNGAVVPRENIWKKPAYQITLGVDTEYVQNPNHPNKMLTTQIGISENKEDVIILEHPSLGIGRLPSWDGSSILSTVLGWEEVDILSDVDGYLVWESLMFFAPSDLLDGQFRDKDLSRKIQRYCKQDARIRIQSDDRKYKNLIKLPILLTSPYGILQVVLKVMDLGKLAVGGLAQTVEGFGGKMLDKAKMDKYKTNMLSPYTSTDLSIFQDYMDYAKDDVCQLFFLREANRERTRVLFGEHSLPLPDREIVTTGSLVATLFQAYIDKEIGSHKAYELFEYTDLKGNKKSWDLEKLLNKSTVKYFAEKQSTKKAALALVQGGRAKNELPMVIKQEGVIADIDLSGAYVTIQKALTYPVGLPCIYGQHESSKNKLTLGQWLRRNEKVLLSRLWSVVVSGKLNHRQTLIPSKVVDAIKISEVYNEDTTKIPADFRLYTRQIINGVITSDVLETLKNVCSKEEYAEYMGLDLVAAAWYPSDLRCETSEEWYRKVKSDKEANGNSVEEKVLRDGKTVVRDNRSRYWLAISLDDFLKPYAAKRKQLKLQMGDTQKGTVEHSQLDAQQNAMKLVGNTNYGVLASPYFPVGNVVVSNNITAAARVAVWLTAVALGCTQTITDGGAYDLNAVRIWKNRKPTMNTIALFRDLSLLGKDTRLTLGTKPLLDSPWEVTGSHKEGGDLYTKVTNGEVALTSKESGWGDFDKAALNHVKDFFNDSKNPLTILDVISYEHKDIYIEAVYQSQTNYRFTHATGEKKTKARGHKLKGKPYIGDKPSTIHQMMEELSEDPTRINAYSRQEISQVLKCNQANEMIESKSDNVYKENGLLAGDSIIKKSWLRPMSLSMFHWETDDQYASWESTVSGLKNKTGWGLEQYFLNVDGTVNYQKGIKEVQNAIDEGKYWLLPKGGRGNIKENIVAKHPYYDGIQILEED